MYSELLQKLAELRKRTARFRRVALHLHSIDSHDWGSGRQDATKNARTRFQGQAGLTAFADELRAHLDLVAVTDHMRCGYATALSKSTLHDDSFTVLPGIEVNFCGEAALGVTRIHLLVIFPEGTPSEVCGRLFTDQAHIPQDSERTGQEDVTDISLKAFVKRVHDNGGICIAAHVNNSQGVRAAFRQTAKETLSLLVLDTPPGRQPDAPEIPEALRKYLLDATLDGLEVHKDSDASHYKWISTQDGVPRAIPTVLRFDAHCVENFARPECVTHVKMTQLGIAGLRDALLFPETRIRFPSNLPSTPSPRLLGLSLQGDADAFFPEATIAFAENLNCIIGARGSGKSTLVEAIRYVLGYNRSLAELGPLEEPIRELQRANLPGTLIRLIYETSTRDIRILTATFDAKTDYATRVTAIDGDRVDIPDVERSGLFPLRLFGWSEIELLGRDPARQREMLDRLIDEIKEPLNKRDEARSELATKRREVNRLIAELQATYAQNDQQIRRFKEYKGDLDRLNTEEVRTLFSELDLATWKASALENLKQGITDLGNELKRTKAIEIRTAADEYVDEAASPALSEWWLKTAIPSLGLADKESGAKASIDAALATLRDLFTLVESQRRAADEDRRSVEERLQKQFAGNADRQKIADLRTNAAKRLSQVTLIRNAYLKTWAAFKLALKDLCDSADALQAIQDQITGIRARHNKMVEERLNSFLPAGMKVSIDLGPGQDTAQFDERLYGLLGARGSQIKKIRAIICRNCTPVQFAQLALKGEFDALLGKADDSGARVEQADADLLRSRLRIYEEDEMADVTVLADAAKHLNELLDIQQTPWDDYEAVLLNGAPVNEKSPGQRSSAMLPLIALSEETPLLIDQPEDNLDKKLIGDVLARVLAELKEKRQIIVSTHDPNIVVGGDAEQVIVLQAESDRRASVIQHGSIDVPDIVQEVIDLLEGGQAAFESRRRRYNDRARP